MNLRDYKKVNFLEIADVMRVKKEKIYNKGNLIIQISATRGQLYYLDEDTKVEPHYAVIVPKGIDSKYLFYILEEELPRFLHKYQDGLNISPEIFKYLDLYIHKDLETQKHIANILDKINEDIEKEEDLLRQYEDFKKYHLDKMFC